MIPIAWYQDLLEQIGCGDIAADHLLSSSILPYRLRVRRHKLRLAAELIIHGEIGSRSLQRYRRQTAPYEVFAEWCFDDSRLVDARPLLREVRDMAEGNSVSEIRQELRRIREGHRSCATFRRQGLARIAGALRRAYPMETAQRLTDCFGLLPVIATQEEFRHMMQARHLIVFGRAVRALEMNVAWATVDEILKAARGRWSE
jgi:hypothetical protein